MRFSIFILLISFSARAWAEGTDNSLDILVSSVIKESSARYTSMMLNATKNGAQTKIRGAKSTPFADKIGEISEIFKTALDILIGRHNIERGEAIQLLTKQLPSECIPSPSCNSESKYRTIDGTCNNLGQLVWGAANRPFTRILPPKYDDGKDTPRGGKVSTLPNVRELSLAIHKSTLTEKIESSVTHMVPQFGQFLDHDITLTPEGGLGCCAMAEADRPDSCWVINVAANDEFYGDKNVPCLDFTRSTASCLQADGIREQMNAITAYIDGSQVYGSDKRVMKMLRSFKGGLLEGNSEHNSFLPWSSDVDPNVQTPGRVKAGDVRADEMPGLAVMHTLFHREHNRIAKALSDSTLFPNDEIIFQETRRIITAELQQITYNEFLPVILGQAAMEQYSLTLPTAGYTPYDPTADATISNSFAVAAYRFGHTMVNGLIKFLIGLNLGDGYPVRENYFSSVQITRDNMKGYDYILGGLINQNSLQYDGEITDDMTNFLFRRTTDNFGSDLAARNIQRGRDHGVPAYTEFREKCGLTPLTTWALKPANIPAESWAKLEAIYTLPTDIDIYTGGLVEEVVTGGQSGATFACLMGMQFKLLKDGDRFFFTHRNQTGSFNENQLAALRKRTLGDIICENSVVSRTTRNVFLAVDTANNPYVNCNDTSRKLDLGLFSLASGSSGKWASSMVFVFLSTLLSKYVL